MTLCVMGSVVRTPVTELYRSSHGDAVFVYLLLFLCLCVALCLILVLSLSFSVPSYFAIILLRKRDMCGSRKFCQRWSKFNSFFLFVCLVDEGIEDPNHYKWAIIDPPANAI